MFCVFLSSPMHATCSIRIILTMFDYRSHKRPKSIHLNYHIYSKNKENHKMTTKKKNDSVRRELQTECILDKIDEYRRNWLLHLQRMPPNRIPSKSYHYRPQGRRTIGKTKKNFGENSCNSGDGTDQRVQSLMFMMMMMNKEKWNEFKSKLRNKCWFVTRLWITRGEGHIAIMLQLWIATRCWYETLKGRDKVEHLDPVGRLEDVS